MTRWITRPWLWTLPAVAVFTAPASAQSITCFGSIIITSLGTEGMIVKVPEGMTVTTTTPAPDTAVVPDPVSTTVPGPVGIDIRPQPPVRPPEPMPNERGDTGDEVPSRGGSDTGTAQSGTTDPAVTEVVDPVHLENPPVDIPVITDPPPPSVDDPIMTTTVDVPAAPTTPPVIDSVPIELGSEPVPIMDTPEPATLTLLGLAGVGALVARRKRRSA